MRTHPARLEPRASPPPQPLMPDRESLADGATTGSLPDRMSALLGSRSRSTCRATPSLMTVPDVTRVARPGPPHRPLPAPARGFAGLESTSWRRVGGDWRIFFDSSLDNMLRLRPSRQ